MTNLCPPRQRCERSAELLSHRTLVRRVAGRIRTRLPSGVGMDELIQAGMIGLNDAMTRYRDDRGASFETYASRRIEGAMLDSLRAADPLSRDARTRLREVRAAVHRLEHRLGRAPRAKEVAGELGWTLPDFHRCMVDAGNGAIRFDDHELQPPDHEALVSQATDQAESTIDEHADPLDVMQRRQRHAALADAFDGLDKRERFVMEMLYEHDISLREIGLTLGVSASRVSQLHEEIVSKLKRRLRDW